MKKAKVYKVGIAGSRPWFAIRYRGEGLTLMQFVMAFRTWDEAIHWALAR